MAQRITRLTTDQKIAGSNPAEVDKVFCLSGPMQYYAFEGEGKPLIPKSNKFPGGWKRRCFSPPGGLEPPTFRLTAERANQLRHGGLW